MATVEEVDAVLWGLLDRFGEVDEDVRALLPNRRTIEARCPDLDYVRHAEWRRGELIVLEEAPPRRADIRISMLSDDLLAVANGELTFSRAYASNRVRLDASMTDLLRLRAVL
ncbi:sterol-binding protein [Egicoccus sp. AB-alg2]|uniref:sterol-binding protein n=1 Tax=Egicoccus sp. AB-alg2 TaxID=3242693 RepID=UPI00359E14AC